MTIRIKGEHKERPEKSESAFIETGFEQLYWNSCSVQNHIGDSKSDYYPK